MGEVGPGGSCPVCGTALAGVASNAFSAGGPSPAGNAAPPALRQLEQRLAGGGAVMHCVACGTPHHAECHQYNGRCAVYGCAGRETTLQPPADVRALLVIADDLPEVPRMFIPVVADPRRPWWVAITLAMRALLVLAAAVAVPRSPVIAGALAMVAASAWTWRRERRIAAASWEVDAERRELALLMRKPEGVERTVFEKLDAVKEVVVLRTDVRSLRARDGTYLYSSEWVLALRWHGRRRDLTTPLAVEGHAEPPPVLLEQARRLARLLARPLAIDPPQEGRLPPDLGRLPSQM